MLIYVCVCVYVAVSIYKLYHLLGGGSTRGDFNGSENCWLSTVSPYERKPPMVLVLFLVSLSVAVSGAMW